MKNGFATLIILLIGFGGKQVMAEQFVLFNSTITLCSGACASFSSLDAGSSFNGDINWDVAPGTWDHSNIVNFNLNLFYPGAPTEPYNGSNPTTANPLPITPATATVRSSSLSGLVTGGSIDEFGNMEGTLLLQLSIPPFNTNDSWLIFDLAPEVPATVQLCQFFETAGCIPSATQAFVAQGSFDFVVDFHLEASPAEIDFGPVAVGDTARQLVNFSNIEQFAASNLNVLVNHPFFSISADTCSLQVLFPGENCYIVIDFAPLDTIVVFTGVTISTDSSITNGGVTLNGEGVPPVDTDNDGVFDHADNCLLTPNDQADPDGDGFGTPCDADFNDDCIVNFLDLAEFVDAFLGMDAEFDLNSDSVINFLDLPLFINQFFSPPGPSNVGRICQ